MWKLVFSVLILSVCAAEVEAQSRPRIKLFRSARKAESCQHNTRSQAVYSMPAAQCCQSSNLQSHAYASSSHHCCGPSAYSPAVHSPTCHGIQGHIAQGHVFNALSNACPPCNVQPSAVASRVPACNCQLGPFSTAGHIRPQTGSILSNTCEMAFLSCCEGVGTTCMDDYMSCVAVTGERIRHVECPAPPPPPPPADPDPNEPGPNP